MISVWKCAAPPNSWLGIASVVIAAMIMTVAGGWFLSLKKIEQRRFARIVLRR
jgi:hypothetical protein